MLSVPPNAPEGKTGRHGLHFPPRGSERVLLGLLVHGLWEGQRKVLGQESPVEGQWSR